MTERPEWTNVHEQETKEIVDVRGYSRKLEQVKNRGTEK
jgi:hypothetical protein